MEARLSGCVTEKKRRKKERERGKDKKRERGRRGEREKGKEKRREIDREVDTGAGWLSPPCLSQWSCPTW